MAKEDPHLKPQKAIADFKMLWASSHPSTLYTPKQKNLFMVQIGASEVPETLKPLVPGATGFYMSGRVRDDARDAENSPDEDSKGFVWYAKTVTKPSIIFTEVEGVDGNTIFTSDTQLIAVGAAPKFGTIKMTLIDPTYPNATRKLLRILRAAGIGNDLGYDTTKAEEGKTRTNAQYRGDYGHMIDIFLTPFKIIQYVHIPKSHGGKDDLLYKAEEWELRKPTILNINFGSLDYAADDFVEIDMEIKYSGFTCKMFNIGDGEEQFNYVTHDVLRTDTPRRD
jgi:hypothetical protein